MSRFYRLLPRLGEERGVFLAIAVIMAFGILTVALAIADYGLSTYFTARRDLSEHKALLAAEAGAERMMENLNDNASAATRCPATDSEDLFDTNQDGRARYEVCVIDNPVNPNEKYIISIGLLHIPRTSTNPIIRKLKITTRGEIVSFDYAARTGVGGLKLENSASIINGKVYVDGIIDMTQGSSGIGTLLTPVEIWVAGHGCTVSGSYPALCPSGTVTADVNNPAEIYSTNFHYNSNHAIDSNRISGTEITDNPPPLGMPDDQREDIKSATQDTTEAWDNTDCNLPHGNKKFTSTVTLDNKCGMEVTGDIWITGDLIVDRGTIAISDIFTDSSPRVMVDGKIEFKGASVNINRNLVAGLFTSFYCGIGCDPDSPPPLTQAMANTDTIYLHTTSIATGSVFYSRWGTVHLRQTASVGGLVGQRVYLEQTGGVSFGSQLGGSSSGSFVVKAYQEIQ